MPGSKMRGRYTPNKGNGSKLVMPVYKKRLPTVKNLDKRIRKIVNKQEIKTMTVYQTLQNVPATGYTQALQVLAQGAGGAQYIGDQFTMTSVQLRGEINSSIADITNSIVRVLIVYDKEGGTPTLNSVLDTLVITKPVYAPYNHDTQQRFKIIYDKVFNLIPSTENTVVAGVTTQVNVIGKYFRLKRRLNKTVKLLLGASIETGSLTLLAVSDNSVNPPTISFGSLIYFKDT